MAEWLRSGLQSRLLRFESGRRLQRDRGVFGAGVERMFVPRPSPWLKPASEIAGQRLHDRASCTSKPSCVDRGITGVACATLACGAGDVIVAVDEVRAPDKHFTAELLEQALRDAVAAVKAKGPDEPAAARAAGARSSTSNGSQAMTSVAASRAIWRSTRQEHWAAGACWSPYCPLHRPRLATAGAHLAARTTHLAGAPPSTLLALNRSP